MNKIASPQELAQEIRRLIAYAENKEPSRQKLADGCRTLANRVAGIFGDKEPDPEALKKSHKRPSRQRGQQLENYRVTVRRESWGEHDFEVEAESAEGAEEEALEMAKDYEFKDEDYEYKVESIRRI